MVFDERHNAGIRMKKPISSRKVPAPPKVSGTQAKRKGGRKAQIGINLRDVAEVLLTYGLDPTVEFAKVLADEGALEPEVRARMCLEIMRYVHPQLKSVEVTQDKPFEAVIRWAAE